MLKYLEEFGTYIKIAGFKKVTMSDPPKFLELVTKKKPADVETQFLDARSVATWQHLCFAVLNALTAFDNKTNISKTLAMETLLYAAGERQITKATKKMGIKTSTLDVAVLIIGKDPKRMESVFSLISRNIMGQHDDKVLELSKSKNETIQKTFNISETELVTVMGKDNLDKALVDLVIERMALLSTER